MLGYSTPCAPSSLHPAHPAWACSALDWEGVQVCHVEACPRGGGGVNRCLWMVNDCSCFTRLAGALYHLLLFGIQLHITVVLLGAAAQALFLP